MAWPQEARRDIGKVMENAVYLHLLQSGHKVHVGQDGAREIDFVAEKSGGKIYAQVSASVAEAAAAKLRVWKPTRGSG